MQCKDIPDEAILRFLAVHGGIGCTVWRNHATGEPYNERSALHAMPSGTPEKLARAKMKRLVDRGLVDGCSCGCRGDWELTLKGSEFLTEEKEPRDLPVAGS
jgi:hypothetical protein